MEITVLWIIVIFIIVFLIIPYSIYNWIVNKVAEADRKVAFAKAEKEFADEQNKKAEAILNNLDEEKQKRLKEIEEEKKKLETYIFIERQKLEGFRQKIERKKEFTEELLRQLDKSHIQGRKWLIDLINKAFNVMEEQDAAYLKRKARPAAKAAEIVSSIKEDNRQLREKTLFLESQLKTYKEYFPFLLDYEEEILNDAEDFKNTSKEDLERSDPVKRLLSSDEYNNLSTSAKNQLALDRFLLNMSKIQVGKTYERYIGWLMEKEGYAVQYDGLLKGLEDRGRDLIVRKKNSPYIQVIQAKCWSKHKTIHEKHIFQLFGTTYELQQKDPNHKYLPIFYTTADLSEYANKVAELLGIKIVNEPLRKDFPMIKCNIGAEGEKIYHLPFDQQYDRTRIDKKGECYALTVNEAEAKGFRRAFKWHGTEV